MHDALHGKSVMSSAERRMVGGLGVAGDRRRVSASGMSIRGRFPPS